MARIFIVFPGRIELNAVVWMKQENSKRQKVVAEEANRGVAGVARARRAVIGGCSTMTVETTRQEGNLETTAEWWCHGQRT